MVASGKKAVKLPDGTTHEFPESMSVEEIKTVLSDTMGQTAIAGATHRVDADGTIVFSRPTGGRKA